MEPPPIPHHPKDGNRQILKCIAVSLVMFPLTAWFAVITFLGRYFFGGGFRFFELTERLIFDERRG